MWLVSQDFTHVWVHPSANQTNSAPMLLFTCERYGKPNNDCWIMTKRLQFNNVMAVSASKLGIMIREWLQNDSTEGGVQHTVHHMRNKDSSIFDYCVPQLPIWHRMMSNTSQFVIRVPHHGITAQFIANCCLERMDCVNCEQYATCRWSAVTMLDLPSALIAFPVSMMTFFSASSMSSLRNWRLASDDDDNAAADDGAVADDDDNDAAAPDE